MIHPILIIHKYVLSGRLQHNRKIQNKIGKADLLWPGFSIRSLRVEPAGPIIRAATFSSESPLTSSQPPGPASTWTAMCQINSISRSRDSSGIIFSRTTCLYRDVMAVTWLQGHDYVSDRQARTSACWRV